LSSSPPEDEVWDELTPPECPQDGEEDGAGLGAAGAELGPAQLGAGAGAAGVATCVGAGGAAAGFGAAGFRAGLGAAGVAAAAGAAFLAGRFLALAFFADFLTDFLTDFFADFLADLPAFFADFLAFFPAFFEAFFEDFLADFFFAISTFFFLAFSFLPFLFFFPLAIVTLLLPPINLYRSLSIGRFKRPLFVRGQSISAVSVQSPIRSVVYRSVLAGDRPSPNRAAQSCAPRELTYRRQSAPCIQYCPQQSHPA
jgi:hypothetical protein